MSEKILLNSKRGVWQRKTFEYVEKRDQKEAHLRHECSQGWQLQTRGCTHIILCKEYVYDSRPVGIEG